MNIVITGATKGIGWAIAQRFAQAGFDLALCARTRKDLEDRRAELLAAHDHIDVLIHPTDMRNKDEVKGFGEFIKSHWKSVDILVNNAGIFLPGLTIEEEEDQLEQQIETNLYSAYHLTRSLLPMMVPQQRGHIFNMCSVASILSYPNAGSYSISKFAMLGYTKVLRSELLDKGIRVTAILPGATWSASWQNVEGIPDERLMQASDIAEAVWSAHRMSASAVVEEILIRPQLGDL